jgi:heme-based aerotactic transducer
MIFEEYHFRPPIGIISCDIWGVTFSYIVVIPDNIDMDDPETAFGTGNLNAQLDVSSLLDKIGLDRREVAWRKDFIDFDDEDARRLSNLEELFRDHQQEIADRFYDNLTSYEQTTEVIDRSEKNVEALKQTQSAYLVSLATGDYDLEYFAHRARIGKLHDMLDMPLKHYLGQYGVYYNLLVPLIRDRVESGIDEAFEQAAAEADADLESLRSAVVEEVESGTDEMLSVLRAINLDMQIATDTYVQSYNEQFQKAVQERERLSREVEADVRGPVRELESEAADAARSAREIDDLSDEQSAEMAEVASEVSDLSATVEEISATANEVGAASDEAESLADRGTQSADEALEVIEAVSESAASVTEDMNRLRERVEEIDDIVAVINDVADQTNLLALNASIEAARAGEAGEGFAVVADEVKSLAEESQEQAGQIESQITGIREDTEDTVGSLEETIDQLGDGIERVESAMNDLTDIARAVEDVSTGIDEVADVTENQAESTESVATMVEAAAQTADRVADEVADVASATEHQMATVEEIADAVERLSDGDLGDDTGHAFEPGRDAAPPGNVQNTSNRHLHRN